ncbi:ABC transporter substrate-binding protein [Sphingomonas sp. H39-1-10]|uniref:ABC transporter substrate-binding protein n=1 Tax=Sphingomonas pollutisoli TaxID=3030829 RepID=UPI0023B8D0AA|nr:ABC transporter substrate-binding protein [Sphingomonas pollutisoli]MDF0489742.1 ABC transporter substrate-binding protein [Sphingomonas pollutisoli]
MRRLLPLAVLLAAGGCDSRPDAGAVVVSAIGGAPALADPARGALATPGRLLLDSAAQGLVRFDAAGQIEPGLAERWTVLDDGRSYIFRIREATWSDGKPVTAAEVVAILKRQLSPASRNPLRPFLTAIHEIVEMTPEVIEVRLSRPRPDLLKLFAQPELAILRARPPGGSGPFRAGGIGRDGVMLRPASDPRHADDDDAATPSPQASVRLIGERAAKAILRFQHRDADLVAGGGFADWPLLAHASIAPAAVRVDPAAGVFGLAIADRTGFLADPGNRAAIAQVIDRDAIVAAFAPGWAATLSILPEQLDSAAPPAVPTWQQAGAINLSPAERVRQWRQMHPLPLYLRVALPAGPGATILYGHVAAALVRIGIVPQRVGLAESADLRLVDAVAPYDSARWYLATACQPCGEAARSALDAARDAPTLAERARHIADADAALAADVAFVPIARPLRWSLVSARLKAWTGNPRAWHPLNRLRSDTN